MTYHANANRMDDATRKYGRHCANHEEAANPPAPRVGAKSGPMQQTEAATAEIKPPAKNHDFFPDFMCAAYTL